MLSLRTHTDNCYLPFLTSKGEDLGVVTPALHLGKAQLQLLMSLLEVVGEVIQKTAGSW